MNTNEKGMRIMEGFTTAILIIVVVFLLVFGAIAGNLENETQQNLAKDRNEKQDDFIKVNNVIVSKEYKYECEELFNYRQIRFIIDDVNKSLYLAESSSRFKKISYKDILGCEIMTNSEVTGGVKRAIIGGILAGETGAIVGAVTSKEHIMEYKIVFYMNDIAEPKKEIVLINTKKSTKDKEYLKAVEFAENITATIKVIINQTA